MSKPLRPFTFHCPKCSYQLGKKALGGFTAYNQDWERTETPGEVYFVMCLVCGWKERFHTLMARP